MDLKRIATILFFMFFLAPGAKGADNLLSEQEASALEESPSQNDESLLAAINTPIAVVAPRGIEDPSAVYPIDLLSALRLAGGNDLEIQYIRERLREAYADEKLAYVRFLPNVSIFGEFLKHEGRIQGTIGDLPRASKQSLFTGVGLEWVYDFSHECYEKLAVRQTRQARQADLDATREQRLYKAAIRFFDLVGARAGEEVALESVHRGEALVSYEENLLKRGKALEADLARAQAFRAERAGSLAGARADRQIASVALATQLRLDPFIELEPVEGAALPIRLVEAGQAKKAMVETALAGRPELRRERLLQSAARTRRDAASKKKYLPRLSGDARIGGFGGDAGSGLREFDDRHDYRLTLEWETDNLGKGDQALLERNSALLGQAQTRYEQIADRVTEEVLIATANVRANEEKMSLAGEQVDAASSSVSLSKARLRSGLAIPYEVIQSEEDLVRAQTNQIQSIVDYNQSELALLRSLGGFESLLEGSNSLTP